MSAGRAGVLVFAALLALGFGGVALAVDTDGDGWTDEYEMYLGTIQTSACPFDLGSPAWPPDLNNDRFVDIIGDISQLAADFGLPIDAPNVADREDISPEPGGDQFIDIFDIVKAADLFGQSCE